MPTEAELEKIRQRNENLRDQITKAQSKKAENLKEQSNEIEAAQLLAEQARLEVELARAKQESKVTTAREGNSNVLDSARLQMEAAAAALENPGGVVDTNAENQPSGTTGMVKAVEGGEVTIAPDGTATAMKPESTSTSTSGSSSSSSSSSSNGGSN